MTSNPKVSVVMSVYNGELYLKEAIDSILNQTFTNFEFIIINDASTDNSRAIIENYNDERIRLLDNYNNQGLPQCLNQGIRIANGKYIARMDADDISLPERLEKQVKFMEENLDIGVCGTWVKIIGVNPEWIRKLDTDHQTMRCNFIFEHQMVHPTVIMRKDLLLKNNLFYNPAYLKAQDYELWCRCGRYFQLANIDEVLLLYRQHNTAEMIRIVSEQLRFSDMIQIQEIRSLGIEPTIEEIELHKEISLWRIHVNQDFVHRNRIWFEKLIEANSRAHYYPEPAFSQNINKRWLKIVEFLESHSFICDNSLLSDHI